MVRAEQIFAAYRQILPPRTSPDRPPRLVLFDSLDAYHAFLGQLGLKIRNRACFVEDKNLVATGSELARLHAVMTKVTAQNDQLRRDLKDLEKRLSDRLRELGDHYKKTGLSKTDTNRLLVTERRKFDDQITRTRKELLDSDHEIARVFNQNMRQTFVLLYHESFHAYLSNYVYPPGGFDVPYWLNEGLAVMFEGGVLEGNTLRIDSPSAASLRRLKADAAAGRPLPLKQLLTAGQAEFLTSGDSSQTAADRYYANAWALAYYLTFERRALVGPALDLYVQPNRNGTTRVQRFEETRRYADREVRAAVDGVCRVAEVQAVGGKGWHPLKHEGRGGNLPTPFVPQGVPPGLRPAARSNTMNAAAGAVAGRRRNRPACPPESSP